ncbi:hypothetical protein NX059_009801 [Plenodomus lindquistii]|nr:hypothetical protein NX059_009801 [Plenodomus lindquistii]
MWTGDGHARRIGYALSAGWYARYTFRAATPPCLSYPLCLLYLLFFVVVVSSPLSLSLSTFAYHRREEIHILVVVVVVAIDSCCGASSVARQHWTARFELNTPGLPRHHAPSAPTPPPSSPRLHCLALHHHSPKTIYLSFSTSQSLYPHRHHSLIMSTFTRQPFGELGSSRLQALQSAKNKQNGKPHD